MAAHRVALNQGPAALLRPCLWLLWLFALGQAVAAETCRGVLVDVIRPIDFGEIRFEPKVLGGWVSLQPDGSYLMSAGLAVSARSQIYAGEVRLRAPPRMTVVLALDGQQATDPNRSFEMAAFKVRAAGVPVQQQGELFVFRTPDTLGAAQVDVRILLGADLLIKRIPSGSTRYTAVMGLRCLQAG